MGFRVFLSPEIIHDTPRLFTAIAEWIAVFVYSFIYKRRFNRAKWIGLSVLSLFAIVFWQYLAGISPLYLWVLGMFVSVLLMYGMIRLTLDINRRDGIVITTKAFVLAEFSASIYRQLYVWYVNLSGKDVFYMSLIFMLVVYILVYSIYYKVEKGNFISDRPLNYTFNEMIGMVAIGLGAFVISNISFINSTSPFSVSGGLLYVRTLVDFGGILMLMTQMNRRNDLIIKKENDEINQLFRRQYEQYKLAIDNSEAFRKEMHDMKHYLAALKGEEDPKKREEVLADMEQTIAIQEAFMNTGNQVLDVILTTKSLQCEKKGIVLNAMIDGENISGIHVKDICSLFGNILDNAIEATQFVTNKDNRIINISCKKKNQFIVVECENYFDHILEKNEMGLILTSKKDEVNHGYGLKSIQAISEKYDGAMTISTENNWFKIKVLLNMNK